MEPDLLAQLQAVNAGKHQVENEQVEVLRLEAAQPILPVSGDLGLKTFLLEGELNGLGHRLLVFYDEDPRHVVTSIVSSQLQNTTCPRALERPGAPHC